MINWLTEKYEYTYGIAKKESTYLMTNETDLGNGKKEVVFVVFRTGYLNETSIAVQPTGTGKNLVVNFNFTAKEDYPLDATAIDYLICYTSVIADADVKVSYGVSLNEHVYLPDGTEKEVRPDSTTTANIALEGVPLRWTGKLMPKDKAMRMFMFKRSYQVQHINGLTFDFLYDMAKKLAEADALMLVGGGAKGNEPLVMSNGGTPYRAFLEGRVNGESYALILRLTNLELKEIPTK